MSTIVWWFEHSLALPFFGTEMKIDLSSPVASYVSITFELILSFPRLNTTFVPQNVLLILFSNVTFILI